MSIAESKDLAQYCVKVARDAKRASAELASLQGEIKNTWLRQSANRIRETAGTILVANQQDLDAAPGYGLTEAQVDRLRLTEARLEAIAKGLEDVASLPDPIGEVIDSTVRPNGLRIDKVRVPLGVVFFVYESRPNVTADAAAICVKSGNAVILRGGKEAAHSSRAIVEVLQRTGEELGLPEAAVQIVQPKEREAVGYFLKLDQYISVAIPRGGEGLIRRVAEEARMPVIKHFTGNCHVYIDQHADLDMACRVTINAKCQRMGVCNAAESLLVNASVAPKVLPRLGELLRGHGVEIRGDAETCRLVEGAVPASDEDYRTEFLGPVISSRVVESLDDAIAHINEYGSGHTDAIITDSLTAARRFASAVDSSAVMINASTRFNDGGEFGLGAEIGISTDKFHARGPCGLNELTSYKYIVYGEGQIRQ